MNRNDMLMQLHEKVVWDIIIIGGGATGLGAAVDAASRGYKTLLLEAHDFGKGTSSRSTKLVHGGVRYLEQGNLKLVKEALQERGWLLHNAPHISATMAFIVPAYSIAQKIYYGTGLKLYDFLAGKLSLGKTKLLNKNETILQLPGINTQKLKGGIVYYDGQFDDARLATDLAFTAVKNDAVVLNYIKVKALLKAKEKICGVVAEDVLNHRTYELKGRSVINATGVFADHVIKMDEPGTNNILAPSQGIHIVVDKKFFPGSSALMIPKTDDGRVLFAVPWHDKVVIGTTDTPIENIALEPRPLDEELEFVLHHANRYLEQTITRTDVTSTYAGLRPLVKMKGVKKTALLNRDHTIIVSKAGLVSITGGKWTTYRKMAEDAINNAVFVAKLDDKECITTHLPIVSSRQNNVPDAMSDAVYSNENIQHFIKEEMAMTVEDILARRTRLLFLDARQAIALAPGVAQKMSIILEKDESWVIAQVKDFNEIAKGYCLD